MLFAVRAAAQSALPVAGAPAPVLERRVLLCDFEAGPAGWTAVNAALLDANADEPHGGEACLEIKKAAGALCTEIGRRIALHDAFDSVAIYAWIETGDKLPVLTAIARDEYGNFKSAPMPRRDDPHEEDDPVAFATLGGWMRFAVSVSNLFAAAQDAPKAASNSKDRHAHSIYRNTKVNPRFLEAVRIEPGNPDGIVRLDDLSAILSEEPANRPMYLASEIDATASRPCAEVRVYNTAPAGARPIQKPLIVEAEIRALDAPLWRAACSARAEAPEPTMTAAETGVAVSNARVEFGEPLPEGAYLAYIKLRDGASTEPGAVSSARILFFKGEKASESFNQRLDAGAAGGKARTALPFNPGDEEFLIEAVAGNDVDLAIDAADALASAGKGAASRRLFDALPSERNATRARLERAIADMLGDMALRLYYEIQWQREISPGGDRHADPLPHAGEPVTLEALLKAHAGIAAKILAGYGVEEIVIAARRPGRDGHWYANISHWSSNPNQKMYGDGGGLARINFRTGETTWLVEDSKGGVRDPRIHYDGKKVLFSYRRGGDPYYNLYEMNLDGSGERRITDAPFDDYEPAYLPDGGIVFVSSRANRWVPCWHTRVGVLHRCDADGGNIRRLSSNVEMENTPWVLPDGRIVYMRWEYVDRSQVHVHQLWTMNPDGTAQMTYFGNSPEMCPGVYLDAKPIPGSRKLIMTHSPGHGQLEGQGQIETIDARKGPDTRAEAMRVSTGDKWPDDYAWREPYPLSEDAFLVARHAEIMLMNARGETVMLYALPASGPWADGGFWVFSPQPVVSRPREQLITTRVIPNMKIGRAFLEDVYTGRNMKGVARGEIKKLLVLEDLPKPVNFSGDLDPLGQFLLRRILGTVPVEPDGSAFFELPAERSLFFVALDENNISVKRMHSFMTVQRGEQVGCVGCHERRTHAPLSRHKLRAMRAPSKIEPFHDIPEVIDFPRDVQPILDRHCIACHGYQKTDRGGPREGGLLLTGHLGGMYFNSMSWTALRPMVKVAESEYRNFGPNYLGDRPPRTQGTAVSPLMRALFDGEHHGVELSKRDMLMLQLWIESSGTYAGTYAALGTWRIQMPQIPPDVFARRCAACHETEPGAWREQMPQIPPDVSARHGASIREIEPGGYDFLEPEKSPVLLKPLNPAAGGWGMVKDGETGWVFEDTDDPGYKAILDAVNARAPHVRKTRFEFKEFQPSPHYIREMKWYGVLKNGEPPDPYELDREYWRMFWP